MLEQLDILTSKLLDGGLDEDERVQLNELLASNECRVRFVELQKVNYCLSNRSLPANTLRTALAASAVHQSILSLANAADPEATRVVRRAIPTAGFGSSRKERRRMIRTIGALATVAAIGLICCIGLLGLVNSKRAEFGPEAREQQIARTPVKTNSKRETPSTEIAHNQIEVGGFAARIVSMSDKSVWKNDRAPGDFLMRLSVGEELKLIRGLVKLEFASKAIAVLSAPAELKILGPGEVLLERGKLTGRSEEGDFTVQTPSAYVVDVGTAFGVAVDDRAVTDVVVFDGEVHVRRSSASEQNLRLTSGMSVRADSSGLNATTSIQELPSWNREFNGQRPSNLGTDEISLVDIICGSAPGEYRFAGSIDPEMGTWSTLPWSEAKGVRGKLGTGRVVSVDWNPWVEGIFIPNGNVPQVAVDLEGGVVDAPLMRGGAWGPIWARRRIERHLDPLADKTDQDVEGFWGAGTTTALLDRSRWVRDGIVGMHANVGITIDLEAIRRGYGISIESLRGMLALLEQSYVSQPFQPQAQATFQIFVDGELRYSRDNFCREDGDALFGAELRNDDRLLSLIVTDGNDGPIYDRVILLDPIFETRSK